MSDAFKHSKSMVFWTFSEVVICSETWTYEYAFSFQIFKGTFHYCEGNRGHVTNKSECLNDSGRWENHMYNFDNLPHVIYHIFKTINVKIQVSLLSLWIFIFLSELTDYLTWDVSSW